MKKYINLFYLPGAAGNLFTRCLNLLDHGYCYTDVNGNIPKTLEEKINLFSFAKVKNFKENGQNWVKFEEEISPILEMYDHTRLPDNGIIIMSAHPQYDCVNYLEGSAERTYNILIDATGNLEWCILNAIYKDSFFIDKWFSDAGKMKLDSDFFKVQLTEIIKGSQPFLEEFKRVCQLVEYPITNEEINAILKLYHQWSDTRLPEEKFEEFKRLINFTSHYAKKYIS